MSCATSCVSEDERCDEASPGPVQNHEMVCRAAYGRTMHFNASGKLRPSFVKNGDLLGGSLSVWRRHAGTEQELSTIRDVLNLNAPAGSRLFDVLGAVTGDVRALRSVQKQDTQVLHVYDDCRTDTNGGKHPNHAVIAICNECEPQHMEADSPLYVEIRDELVKLLKQTYVWSLQASERA